MESWRDIDQLPEKPIKIDKKIWEKPIISHNDFVVGFIDMEVVCRVSKLFFHSNDDLPNLGVN